MASENHSVVFEAWKTVLRNMRNDFKTRLEVPPSLCSRCVMGTGRRKVGNVIHTTISEELALELGVLKSEMVYDRGRPTSLVHNSEGAVTDLTNAVWYFPYEDVIVHVVLVSLDPVEGPLADSKDNFFIALQTTE